MSGSGTTPWLAYLAAAAEMRLVVQQNEDDYLFETKQGGRIVYLFDASVVHIFLNPAKGVRQFSGFGGPVSQDDRLATTMIAAEFMFSRRLSGQGGIPAFLSPGHADDLAAQVQQIQWNVRRKSSFEPAVAKDVARIAKIVREVRAEKIDDIDARRQLSDAFPILANTLFDGAPYEARQFRRLMKDDLVRPLALLPECTLDVLAPDQRLVDEWVARIRSEIPAASEHQRSEEGIRRDAQTMVQLLLLNEVSKDPVNRNKYVLVTTDRALSRAYGKYFAADPYADPKDYALRQPQQYLPMLNTQQMSRGTLRSELIQNLREAFDSLFPFGSLGTGEYLRLISAIADPSLADLLEGGTARVLEQFISTMQRRSGIDALEVVRKRWQQAARAAVVLNSSWLRVHFREGWEVANEMIHHTQGMEQGILNHLAQLLSEVESAHASFVAEGFLDRLGGDRSPAVPPLFRFWDEEEGILVVVGPSEEFWERVKLIRSSGRHRRGQEWQVLTWAAESAFRSRKWAECVRYTRRSRSLLLHSADVEPDRQEAERHELHYLECAAAFHQLDEERYQRSRAHMDQSLRYFLQREDDFGIVRTHLGISRLELSFFVQTHRSPARASKSRLGVRHYFEAVEEIAKARYETRSRMAKVPYSLVQEILDETMVLLHALDLLVVDSNSLDETRVLEACDRLQGDEGTSEETPAYLQIALRCCRELQSWDNNPRLRFTDLLGPKLVHELPDHFAEAFIALAISGMNRHGEQYPPHRA